LAYQGLSQERHCQNIGSLLPLAAVAYLSDYVAETAQRWSKFISKAESFAS